LLFVSIDVGLEVLELLLEPLEAAVGLTVVPLVVFELLQED